MKNLKKFLFILLTLALAISLFACGGKDPCKTHSDENEDGKCDKCGEAMKDDGGAPAGDVVLVENGEAKFQIVYADGFSTMLMGKVNKMKTELLDIGIDVERVADKADNVKDCEILIGNIKTRDSKYLIDGHDYGMEGYVIKIIGSKLIINAGSEEMLIEAIDVFLEDIVEIKDDEKDFENLVVTADQQVEVIQDDYKVTSLAVGGKDMKGYTIALDKANTYHMDAAKAIQETVYERTGYWFELVSEDKATDKSVLIKSVAKDAVDGGFKISASGNKLIIECGYDNMAKIAVEDFLSDKVVAAKGAVDFKGTVYTDDISVVYYKDFGAKGDGRTDDFFALKDAHDFANISGQLVKAESGKTYYIHETRKNGANKVHSIEIRTNVDWTGAKFIIDDSDISTFDGTKRTGSNIFVIKRDTPVKKISDRKILDAVLAAGLNRDTTKIDLGLNEKVMIAPYNSSHNVYRRKGYGSFLGATMKEVIVIDENGNVDAETPVMFDYTNIDYINVYSLKDEAITIEGGEFTTRASHIDIVYYDENGSQKFHDGYVARGISIARSYTTLKDVKHYVTGEISLMEQSQGQIGTAYSGFFQGNEANHITLDGCVFSGRRCYTKPVGGTTGTYGIGGEMVNKLVFKNCRQQNFWVTVDENGNITTAEEDTPDVKLSMASVTVGGKTMKMHWGCGGTNFCKNMEFIDSTISRFDAHCGLYNGKIINSTVNYIAITGVGDMIIKNSRWFAEGSDYGSNSLIHLREDYGSIWDGKITIDGMKAYIFTHGSEADNYKGTNTWIFMHTYNNWYYGYQCAFPSIEINNLDYYDIKTREALPPGFEVKLCNTSVTSERALHLPETLKTSPLYPYVDNDGDGIVDNTKEPYDKSNVGANWGGVTTSGIENLNPIKPPEVIKITGNDGVDRDGDGTPDGGYIFTVPNTAGYNVSDGGYYDNVESFGGFFGDTKFWYGDGENDYYLGTDYVGQTTEIFKFITQ